MKMQDRPRRTWEPLILCRSPFLSSPWPQPTEALAWKGGQALQRKDRSSLYQSMAPLQSCQNNYLKTLLHLLILPRVYFAWNVTLLLHILAWLTPHFLGLCSNITSTERLTLTMVSDVTLPAIPACYPLSPLPNLFFHEKLVSPHIYLRI